MDIGYSVTDDLPECLPKDAETMRYTTFTVKKKLDSSEDSSEAFISLLKRMMPADSIHVFYFPEDYASRTQEIEVGCWLSDSELKLISELNGTTASEEETEEDPEEATDDGVDQDR